MNRPEVLGREQPESPRPCEIADNRRAISDRFALLVKRIEDFGLYQTAQAIQTLQYDVERQLGDTATKPRFNKRVS